MHVSISYVSSLSFAFSFIFVFAFSFPLLPVSLLSLFSLSLGVEQTTQKGPQGLMMLFNKDLYLEWQLL